MHVPANWRSDSGVRKTHFNAPSWLRIAIQHPKGRKLRVVIYARFSTDEQNPRSIDDQIDFCKKFLASMGISDVEIHVLSDAGISGELRSRPGINQVKEGIRTEQWDLVLVEDASRLYRDPTYCDEFVGQAVDRGVRVICINDRVDSADPDEWEDRLSDASRHHARSNRDTSRRIMRAHDALWAMGAAMGILQPGYRRKPSAPATEREPERGPFFDEIDHAWQPVIVEAFERIAAGASPSLVGQWLTKEGLPKTANSKALEWSDRNVIALIRRTDYRGAQRFRQKVVQKRHGTGQHVLKRNDPEKVLRREMPHLRIVSDAVWHQANAAISARNLKKPTSDGRGTRLVGVPRDSQGPLSRVFICAICGGKMYMAGRNEGGYQCQGARPDVCWNKATALRDLTHDRIRQAILEQLPTMREMLLAKIPAVRELLDDGGRREQKREELQGRIQQLEGKIQGLVLGIEAAPETLHSLVENLGAREEEWARAHAELDQWNVMPVLPTAQEIDAWITEIREAIAPMDRTAGHTLDQMLSPIQAVPCQQFGGNKVVLVATFNLNVASLLPASATASLAGVLGQPLADVFGVIPVTLELFQRSVAPQYAFAALELRRQGLSFSKIGKQLGISKRDARVATQYGTELRSAGLTDPFIRLTEKPSAASRWREPPALPDDA